jgi:hypothetical protein
MKKFILSLFVAVGLIGSGDAATIAAQWQLNGNANDFVGYSDGSASNIQWVTGTDAGGNSRQMAYFNGSSSISVAPTTQLNMPASGFSMTAWVNVDTFSNTGGNTYYDILSAGGVTHDYDDAYNLKLNSQSISSQLTGSGYSHIKYFQDGYNLSNDPSESSIMSASNWYLVALVYDGNNQYAYINGNALTNQSGISGNIQPYNLTNPLYIGSRDLPPEGYDMWFKGYMYDVTLYYGALTSQQINQLYTIPEPSTYALFGLGAIGMLMVLWRKKTA